MKSSSERKHVSGPRAVVVCYMSVGVIGSQPPYSVSEKRTTEGIVDEVAHSIALHTASISAAGTEESLLIL